MLYYTDSESREGKVWKDGEIQHDQFKGDTYYGEDTKWQLVQNLQHKEIGIKSFIEIECQYYNVRRGMDITLVWQSISHFEEWNTKSLVKVQREPQECFTWSA